jgi:SAM-dependent methyltransferase
MTIDDPNAVSDFYDGLAPYYHLIFQDWEASIARQADALDSIIRDEWGGRVRSVLDASCGIGTQTFALHSRGYAVTASDLSQGAIDRATEEARARGASIDFSVADMRRLSATHTSRFDLIVSCDNSVPHLQTDQDLLTAFGEFHKCAGPGGGCLISVRDYAAEELTGPRVKPYGVRYDSDATYMVLQLWEFDDPAHYTVSMYFIRDGGDGCETRVFRTRYYAITTDALMELMRASGFVDVRRIDGRFYQPVLLGTRPLD